MGVSIFGDLCKRSDCQKKVIRCSHIQSGLHLHQRDVSLADLPRDWFPRLEQEHALADAYFGVLEGH